LERNNLEFFFKGVLRLDQTESLCEKANTLSNSKNTLREENSTLKSRRESNHLLILICPEE
jgi:hypothetical protein